MRTLATPPAGSLARVDSPRGAWELGRGPRWERRWGPPEPSRVAWGAPPNPCPVGRVGALVAVNCFGEVVDPDDGRVLAGPVMAKRFASTLDALRKRPASLAVGATNSTIGWWPPTPASAASRPTVWR